MRTRHALLTPLLGLGLALSIGACSSAGEQVADKVDAYAAKQLDLTKDAVTTTCPKGAKAEKGAKFDCTVGMDGQSLKANVEFTTSKKFTFTFDGQVFDRKKLQTNLEGQILTAYQVTVNNLSCPGKTLVVISKAGTVKCSGTSTDGTKGSVTVGLDKDGNAVITAEGE